MTTHRTNAAPIDLGAETKRHKKSREGRTLREDKDACLYLGLNAGQVKGINALVKSGLWGNTAAECARRLIDDGLLRHLYER